MNELEVSIWLPVRVHGAYGLTPNPEHKDYDNIKKTVMGEGYVLFWEPGIMMRGVPQDDIVSISWMDWLRFQIIRNINRNDSHAVLLLELFRHVDLGNFDKNELFQEVVKGVSQEYLVDMREFLNK